MEASYIILVHRLGCQPFKPCAAETHRILYLKKPISLDISASLGGGWMGLCCDGSRYAISEELFIQRILPPACPALPVTLCPPPAAY